MPPATAPPEIEELVAFLAGLGVRADARILDVPCGLGRRAHALAEHGFRVTAVDSNTVAIEALRRRVSKQLGHRLDCRVSTKDAMPGVSPAETFDVVLCLDHALGREEPDMEENFLARLRRQVSPGGLLLLDILHRDHFAARPRPFAYHVIGDVEQHEFRTFDPLSGVLELRWRFYRRKGEDLRFQGTSSARLRLLAPHEVEKLVLAAGWRPEAWYGGWGKEAVSADRRKLLLIARPAARS